jgi:membrane dipeptidase
MSEGLGFDLDDAAEQRATRLHEESVFVDGLIPTRAYLSEPAYRDHLERGGVTAGNVTVASRTGFADAARRVQRCRRLVREQSDRFVVAETAADVRAAHREGRVAVVMGFQDAMPLEPADRMQLDGEFEYLRAVHDMGVRVVQLTYNSLNYVGAGCCERVDPGLSNFGRDLVDAMAESGVVVDLSHCGDRTTADAVDYADQPVVFSHVGARALSNVKRNKTDDHLRALADNGGVAGVSVFPPTVKTDPDTHEVLEATVHDVLDHVDHVVDVAGVDHVAFGSDMNDRDLDEGVTPPYAAYRNFRPEHADAYGRGPIDHYEPFPRGLHRHTKLLNLTRGLVARGYGDDEIRKILGGNFLRVFETVWGE